MTIIASGDVIYADPHDEFHTTPDGVEYPLETEISNMVVMSTDVKSHSLIGNIAHASSLDGKGFFVGSMFQGLQGYDPMDNTTDAYGQLFLGFNDAVVFSDRSGYDAWGFGGDNHGYFEVTITIEPQAGS